MTTKTEIAKKIFEANQGIARKDMIEKFMTEAGLTQAGASTYYANFKKMALTTSALQRIGLVDAPQTQETSEEVAETEEVVQTEEVAETEEVADEFEQAAPTKNEAIVDQVFAKADSKPARGPGGRFIKKTA